MNTEGIIAELEAERDRLTQAIGLLQGNQPRRGRPRGTGKRRRLSPAAKKRISDAMKKRWAARKKAAKAT